IPAPAAFEVEVKARNEAIRLSRQHRVAEMYGSIRARVVEPVPRKTAADNQHDIDIEPYRCTCCAEPTYITLRAVPLCSPCAVNLIDARGRQLTKGQASIGDVFPVEGMKCGKRGHRPSKTKAVSKAA